MVVLTKMHDKETVHLSDLYRPQVKMQKQGNEQNCMSIFDRKARADNISLNQLNHMSRGGKIHAQLG